MSFNWKALLQTASHAAVGSLSVAAAAGPFTPVSIAQAGMAAATSSISALADSQSNPLVHALIGAAPQIAIAAITATATATPGGGASVLMPIVVAALSSMVASWSPVHPNDSLAPAIADVVAAAAVAPSDHP